MNEDIIVSVSDDGFMNFWDLRDKNLAQNVLTADGDSK